MTELPKRQLGRTGLQVTMLGYGAMELRGAPRGRDVTDTQARKECAQRKQENSADCSKLATAELREQCVRQKSK